MAKIIEKSYKVATKEIHTSAADYFDHLVDKDGNFIPDQIEEYSVDELSLLRKVIDAKGFVKPGEKYLFIKAKGLKRDGDDWTGIVEFEYPEGIHEMIIEHDLFDN